MDVAYINPFVCSVVRVFKEMLHVGCVVGKPFIKRPNDHFHELYSHAAAIELSGPISGMIALSFSDTVAITLASAFAGEKFECVADCADALGEITNMVAGAAKKEMPGGQVAVSIARLMRTRSISYPPNVSVIMIPFDTDKGRFVMEVALQRRAMQAALV